MKKIRLFLTGLLLVVAASAMAQDITVTGTVTDASTGEKIVGASVLLKGSTTQWAMTDDLGAFSLTVPSNGVLEVSFLGYAAQDVPVNGRATIEIALEPETEMLEDVIVVAYGTAKKESFTGSAAVVKNDDIIKRSVSNVTKAIEGLVAGVEVTSGSGQPGEGASIQIRGAGSINASSSPLYVVDGIPFDGSLSSINPQDIESMTVLKDASAGALYGARGANGVVVITTKKGKEGRVDVNLKAQVGWQSRAIPRYDLVNQNEFVELTYESLYNTAIDGGYSVDAAHNYAASSMSSTLGGELYNPYKNYTWATVIDPATGQVRPDAVSAWNEDWMDELTNTKALRQEYQVGVNGGNERTKYNFSAGYLRDEGVLITSLFSRYSARAGVDHEATKWLRLSANLSYSYTDANQAQNSGTQTNNVWYTAQFMAPIYPVYMKDDAGKDLLDEDGNRQYDYGFTRPTASRFNPIGDLYENMYRQEYDNVSFRTFARLGGDDDVMGVLKGLALTVNFGGDLASRRITSYTNPYTGDGASTNGSIDKYSTRNFSYTFNQLLTYDRRFDKHNISVLLGHEYYNYTYNYLYANSTGIYPGIPELAPATTVADHTSYTDTYVIESFLSRVNYDYDNKYFISASWRTDGSSRFEQDHRWGQFWSVGASWRISEERWMNAEWINNMTLKASYGVQGNDNLNTYYAWQGLYDLGWPNASNMGGIVSTLENPLVTWEKKNTLNVGLETSLFNRVLDLTVEYYYSRTNDLLLASPMALSTGFSSYNANVGSMDNQGVEATIRVNWLNRDKFQANSTLMLYHNQNKVVSLVSGQDRILDGQYLIEVGLPINSFYMVKTAGVDPATGNQLYWAYETDANGQKIEGSDYVTSNGTAAANSRYVFDSREPVISGSFGSNFYLGSFDFSFLTTFSIGGNIYNGTYSGVMEPMYYAATFHKNQLRRWQKPGDITDVPKLKVSSGRKTINDRWLIDASYFAIRSVQLGYTLPTKWTEKANISSIRIYAVGDNLALFSHLDGMDPQYSFSGGQGYTYLPTRTVSIGIDINF